MSVPAVLSNQPGISPWFQANTESSEDNIDPITRFVSGIAVTAQSAAAHAPASLAFYEVELEGPTLNCTSNSQLLTWLREAIAESQSGTDQAAQIDLLSWTSDDPMETSTVVDISKGGITDNSTVYSHLFLANRLSESVPYLIDCLWHQSAYRANFTFNGTQQSVYTIVDPVRNIKKLSCLHVKGASDVAADSSNITGNEMVSCALADRFDQLFTGFVTKKDHKTAISNSSLLWTSIDWTTGQSAACGMEQLFWNISYSLMAMPALRCV
jgi:hypothetical protein